MTPATIRAIYLPLQAKPCQNVFLKQLASVASLRVTGTHYLLRSWRRESSRSGLETEEVAETRYAWEVIATAPGTVHYSPAAARFGSQRFAASLGQLGATFPLLKYTVVVCLNRFSGHDLTLLSHDEKA
jgi:hypothetical protein